MDTLFWKQLHPDIKVQHSKQMLYGKYPCRLVIRCNGSSMLRYPETPFADQMEWNQRVVNYGGSWRRSMTTRPSAKDLQLLVNLKTYRADLAEQDSAQIKIRIEDPMVQIYATDTALLEEFARQVFAGIPDVADFLESITIPKDTHDLALLEQGYVLRSHSDFLFKINLRDGKYSQSTRSNLLQYLDALAPDVSIPKNTRDQLEKVRGDFIWGGYFYAMDEDIKLMIGMINPKLIRSVDRFYSTAK